MARAIINWDLASQKERDEEWERCAMDPVYFINQHGIANNVEKNLFGPIECFEYQERVIEQYLEHSHNIILKSRQTGISVITAAYVAWRLMFKFNERILILANNGKGAKRFLSYVKVFIDALPKFLQPMNGRKEGRLKWNDNKVHFSNMSWAESVAASAQAGRGEQLSLVILDEFAFVEKDKDIWTAVSYALSTTQGDCIMISTPYGSGNVFHKNWIEAERGTGKFNPIKVHWTENPFCARGLEKREENGRMIFWSPWYEDQKKTSNYDSVKIAQELDLSFLGSKLLAVDEDSVLRYKTKIEQNNIEPVCYFSYREKEFTNDKTTFWVWKKPEAGSSYILGVDVSRGDGKDYSTIQVIDVKTLEQVAEYQDRIDPDILADVVEAIGMAYNEAFAVVEANSFGLATAFSLTRRLNYKNYFTSKSIKKMHVRSNTYRDQVINEDDSIPGFQTTLQSKVMVVDTIRSMMRENVVTINSLRLINEFSTWVMENRGQEVVANAEKGYHDDLIMAFGIALYVRQTEYSNLVSSKKMTKAMLESIGMSTTKMYEPQKTLEQKQKESMEKKESEGKSNGIFVFRGDKESEDHQDDDDLSWLMG